MGSSDSDHLLYSALAEIYAANSGFGDLRVAETKLLSGLQLSSNREDLAEVHNLLAQIFAQTSRPESALKHYRAALTFAPEQAVILTTTLAEYLEKHKEWKAAIRVYKFGLKQCQDAGLHNGLAYCLSKIDHLVEAELHGRKACQLTPDNANYANDLGCILMGQEKLANAESYFNLAIRIDPEYELAGNNLNECLQRIEALKFKMTAKFTEKQGQYLAFIYHYSKIHGRPPAEWEIEHYFHVADSTVHQMILLLEKKGFITRTPGTARSIKLLLSLEDLPNLK